MASSLAVLTVGLISITTVLAALPSYFKNCYRSDPKFDSCLVSRIEALRPIVRDGIPELAIPPLEPLQIRRFTLRYQSKTTQVYGKDFIFRGASNYEIEEIKADLPNKVHVKMRFPKLKIVATYDIIVKFLDLTLKGKGTATVEPEDIKGNFTFKGHLVEKGGQKYITVDTVEVKLNWKNYVAKVDEGFFKDPAVTDVVNTALEENKQEIINLLRPRVESVGRDIFLRAANKLTKLSTYDELFPLTKPPGTK